MSSTDLREISKKCHCETSVSSAQNPELVLYITLGFIFVYTQGLVPYTFLYILYTSFKMFLIKKHTLPDLMQGCIESVTVCAWGHQFPLCKEEWAEHLLQCLCSEQLFPLSWPGACTYFPTKTNQGIIGASCGDVLMM